VKFNKKHRLINSFKIVQNDEPQIAIEAIKVIINFLLYFDLESSEFIDDEDESISLSYPILIPTILKYLSTKLDSKVTPLLMLK
jgi:hypothetical protein